MSAGDITDSASIELRGFERVEAWPGTALLRIAARAPVGTAMGPAPTLVIDDGAEVHRLRPLQSPPDPPGLLRPAYSAPVSLLEGDRTAFSLELPGGEMLHLPPPVLRARRSQAVRHGLDATHGPGDLAAEQSSGTGRPRRGSLGLPSEALLGVCLVVLGVTLAVLLLTGAVNLGLAR